MKDVLTAEQARRVISLAEASKLLRGRGGRRPSVATVRRWANPNRGCRVPGRAEPVVLMTVRLGQDKLTLPEWVEAFQRARLVQEQPLVLPRTERTRKADQRWAKRVLDQAGI